MLRGTQTRFPVRSAVHTWGDEKVTHVFFRFVILHRLNVLLRWVTQSDSGIVVSVLGGCVWQLEWLNERWRTRPFERVGGNWPALSQFWGTCQFYPGASNPSPKSIDEEANESDSKIERMSCDQRTRMHSFSTRASVEFAEPDVWWHQFGSDKMDYDKIDRSQVWTIWIVQISCEM